MRRISSAMGQTVGEFLLRRLRQWGIRRLFGYPGDGINGIDEALPRLSELEYIQVRHEEMAAFMACAHAKFTGEPGVCLATSGSGAIHLLNGLYDAKMDHQPVVAIVGQAATTAIGSHYQQEVDLQALFKDAASEYVVTAMAPSSLQHCLDRALRIARVERTVTCVIIPKDIQEEDFAPPPHAHNTSHTGIGYSSPRIVPRNGDLKRAADVLNAGKKVAMLIGAGALRARAELVETADLLGAGVAKALLGKAALPDALTWVTGAIGLVGTKPSWDLMQECDTLFMIGSSFPYNDFLPRDGQARGVQIDIDGRMLSLRYPMEVNLQGDTAETLRALNPLLVHKQDRAWQQRIERNVADWWKLMDERAHTPANPINPQLLFWELSPRLPDGAILTADAGSSATWFARDLKIRDGMMASLSGNLATMGPAVPYALAAKLAYPDRPVFAFVGDGAMQMNGMNELVTVAKYCKQWRDQRLYVVVLNNHDLSEVTWELRALSGSPDLPRTQDIPDVNYAAYAQSLGLAGIRIETAQGITRALDVALASDKPVVIDCVCDPDVAPLPPHISLEEARAFTASLIKRDPHRRRVVTQAWRAMFPKRH
jgi:pyruvate dehydrogenase (quinone)